MTDIRDSQYVNNLKFQVSELQRLAEELTVQLRVANDRSLRGYDGLVDSYEKKVAALEAELKESARLHGLGASREARLLAEKAELEAELKEANSSYQGALADADHYIAKNKELSERVSQLEKALREILEAGTEDAGTDTWGQSLPWEKFLLYNKDVSLYWKLLEGKESRQDTHTDSRIKGTLNAPAYNVKQPTEDLNVTAQDSYPTIPPAILATADPSPVERETRRSRPGPIRKETTQATCAGHDWVVYPPDADENRHDYCMTCGVWFPKATLNGVQSDE